MDFFIFFWWIFVACVVGLLIILLVTYHRSRSASPKYSHPTPSHGTSPKKVSAKIMGAVVYSYAYENATDIVKRLREYQFLSDDALMFYPFCYTFYFATMRLQKKYGHDVSSSVLEHAITALESASDDKDVRSAIRDEVNRVFKNLNSFLDDFKNEDPDALRHVSKQFLLDVTDSDDANAPVYDIRILTEITIHIVSWIKYSEFLVTEYELDPALLSKQEHKPPCNERQERSSNTNQTYLMETWDGMLVWVPEDKLDAFEANQARLAQQAAEKAASSATPPVPQSNEEKSPLATLLPAHLAVYKTAVAELPEDPALRSALHARLTDGIQQIDDLTDYMGGNFPVATIALALYLDALMMEYTATGNVALRPLIAQYDRAVRAAGVVGEEEYEHYMDTVCTWYDRHTERTT